jgi:hypothetical protein
MYMVEANIVVRHENGWTSRKQIPTFFLDENVQGIVDVAHAVEIVEDILNPMGYEHVRVYAIVAKLDEEYEDESECIDLECGCDVDPDEDLIF